MIKTIDDVEYIDMNIMSRNMTNEECNDKVIDMAQGQYCPEVKKNCLGASCAFFEVDRPCADKRILKATCTYAGKRDLAMWDGFPKEEDEEGATST